MKRPPRLSKEEHDKRQDMNLLSTQVADMTSPDIQETAEGPWKVGDRVAWPHKVRAGRFASIILEVGTVTAVDLPGLPRGVQITFDDPVDGAATCYATYREIQAWP
jgi:hypothetical protein